MLPWCPPAWCCRREGRVQQLWVGTEKIKVIAASGVTAVADGGLHLPTGIESI